MPKLRLLSAKEVCAVVVVPNHSEIAKGTLASIIKQSGLDAALFRK